MNARTIEGYGSTRIYISFMVEVSIDPFVSQILLLGTFLNTNF
jgi:hypothetical protein